MNKKNKDILVLGFALFSMFFGAGNLIFPPFLGITTGNKWWLAAIGFVITAVGLPVLGVITNAKYSENIDALANKVSPSFSKLLGIATILAIGPMLAMPRTAATTYELTVVPIFGNIPIVISSVIFFSITLFFALNESSVTDVIGKVLTPVLLFMIFVIITKAVITPIGTFKTASQENFFLNGFTEGYQTMDALASLFMFSVIIESLKRKGYESKKEIFEMSVKTGLIAATGLAIVYVGLAYVGATASNVVNFTDRSKILIFLTDNLLGKFGVYALGIAMLMACLTTAIGLTCTVANYFEPILKISYKKIAIITCIFSCGISVIGLEKIVSVSIPILITMYPVVITLLLLNIFDKYIKENYIYKGSVIVSFAIGLIEALSIVVNKINTLNISIPNIITEFLEGFLNINTFISTKLPFSNIGMPYIVPSLVFGILYSLILKKHNKKIESINCKNH